MKRKCWTALILIGFLACGAFARDEATFRIFLQECGVTDAAAQAAAVKSAEEKGLLDFSPRTCRPYDVWKQKFVDFAEDVGAGRAHVRNESYLGASRAEIEDVFVRVWPDPWTRSNGTDPDQAIKKAVKWFLLNGPKMDAKKDARVRGFGAGLILRASERYNRPEWKAAALELGKPHDERGLKRLLDNSVDFPLENHIRERIPHYLREQLVSHDGALDGAWTDEAGAGRARVRGKDVSECVPHSVSPMMTAVIPLSLMKALPPVESDVTVFKAGMEIDGRVCKIFRIPAFSVAPNGDLVAVCDARWTSHADLFEGGDISLAVSRSTDRGRTWSAPALAWKFPAKEDGGWSVSDPSLVTDAVTKEMFLLQNARDPADKKNRRFVFLQKSTDNGRTWTKPVDITSAFREKDWKDDEVVFVTSGRGCQFRDGTLAFCQNHVDGSRGRLVGSRDHGKTWTVLSGWFGGGDAGAGRTCVRTSARPAPSGTDESKVVELADGRLMVMAREGFLKKGAPVGHKLLFVSEDHGKTWLDASAGAGRTRVRSGCTSPRPAPSEVDAAALVSPACNGAILRMNDRLGRDSLVAAVPYARTRQNVSLLVSRDAGQTWGAPTSLWIGPSAYADLADLGGGTVGVLYERGDLSYHDGIGFRAFDIAGPQSEPATVQRPDGSLYTLCYQADRLNEHPCILGCGWRLPSDERFVLVKDGALQVEVVCGDSEPEQLAKSEFLRVMDAVTGCGTNVATCGAAGIRALPVMRLSVAPSLGNGDTYDISFHTSQPPQPSQLSQPPQPPHPSLLIRGSNPRSVVFGMMALLQRLGCRWFWPGEDGEYLPAPAKDLSVSVFTETSTAAFPYRQLSSHPHRQKAWFFCHNRMNPWTGSDNSRYRVYWGQTSAWGGHSFGWIWPEDVKSRKEYFEKHPDQFALWNGKRVTSQHCYTNPDTIKTFQDWILRFWSAHPETEILNLSALDTPIYCTCPECAKKDSSTLFFDFVNAITEPARKKFPKGRYSTIAYSFYLNPPKTKLAPDVMMSYCMYNRCYCHDFADATCPINPRAMKGMLGWRDVLGHAPNIYGYHFDVWGGPEPYPAPFAPVLQEEAKRARDAGVLFWFTEYNDVPERMNAMRFEAYAFAQLAWNPDLDFAALRRDWCRRVYGPAAKPMEAYVAAFENAWQTCGQHIGGYNNAPSKFVDKFVTDELIKFVDAQFEAAEKALARSPDPRAARQVAYDKELWGRWRELKVSRGNWSALADKPDPDRLAWFAKCLAGDVVYPREGENADWKDRDYVPEFYTTPRGHKACKDDSFLWGNHPRCFGDQGWINYEVSYSFRFPEEKSQQTLLFRCGGQRLENQRFGHYRLNITRRDVSLHRYDGHGAEYKNPCLVRVKRPLTDVDWHKVVVRAYDTHVVITLDGEKVIEEDILLGGGYVNICAHGQPLGVRDFTVRLLDDPTKEDLRRMKDPTYKPKTFIDGNGKVINRV